jgi:hypothetical protein
MFPLSQNRRRKNMYIKNQEFYHIHKCLGKQYEHLWRVGSEINFTKKQINNFNTFYDNYYPTICIDETSYSIMDALNLIQKNKLYSSVENTKIILEKLETITKQQAIYIRESIFEEIRADHFTDLPSRKSCIWVCEEHALEYWKELLLEANCKIFKVNLTGVIHKADQKHLKADVLPCELIRKNAFNYWTGSDSKNISEVEILFEGLVKIVEEIKPGT